MYSKMIVGSCETVSEQIHKITTENCSKLFFLFCFRVWLPWILSKASKGSLGLCRSVRWHFSLSRQALESTGLGDIKSPAIWRRPAYAVDYHFYEQSPRL